jgi:hypothetical protein
MFLHPLYILFANESRVLADHRGCGTGGLLRRRTCASNRNSLSIMARKTTEVQYSAVRDGMCRISRSCVSAACHRAAPGRCQNYTVFFAPLLRSAWWPNVVGVYGVRVPSGFASTFALVALAQENTTDGQCPDKKMIDEASNNTSWR